MGNTEVFKAQVVLNAEQAKNTLTQLEGHLKELKTQRKAAFSAGQDISGFDKEIKQTTASMKMLKTEEVKVADVMKNLASASVKDMKKALSQLNKELNSGKIERESAEWKKYTNQIKQVKGELAKVYAEREKSGSIFSRLGDGFNKYAALGASAIASMTGLTMTVRKCTDDYAKMDQSMANVRKYTGQTSEQVKAMNEDFKKMDTRTSREQLNELASAAGRLGITSTEMIEEFVDGADKIGVALGDDLGEGAVDKIGKLAQMFGEDKTKGLRGAMLATGSAVNELAQNSSANAGYIVDFTADLSGVGKQAGLTQAQIMGLGSALDQNMQEEATASTVFSQLITKMFQDPAKFAKLAGEDVKDFTNLLKTDANSALLEFLNTMQQKGGFADMAPMFEKMNLNGSRSVGVLSAVASHLDQVKTAQDLATKSYDDGTSVIKEYNVQNTTEQAKIEKAQKAFHDLSIELGEKLLPIVRYTITAGSLTVKGLKAVIDFVLKYKAIIITVTATLLTYIAVKKINWLWDNRDIAAKKLKTIWMAIEDKMLEASILKHAVLNGTMTKTVAIQKLFNNVLKLNPYAAALAAVTALIAALIIFTRKTDFAAEAQKTLNAIKKKAVEEMQDEKSKVDTLIAAAKDEKLSLDSRQAAIKALNRIIPNYNAQLDATTGQYKANKTALDNYLVSLQKKYELEGAKDKLKEIGKELADANIEVANAKTNLKNARKSGGGGYNYTTSWGSTGNTTQDVIGRYQQNLNAALDKQTAALFRQKSITNAYGSALEQDAVNNTVKQTSGENNGSGVGGGLAKKSKSNKSDKKDIQYNAELKAAENAYAKEKLALSKSLLDKSKTQDEYDDESYQKNIDYLSKKLSVQKKYGKSTTSTEQEMTNAQLSEVDRRNKQSEAKMNEDLRKRDLAYNAEQMQLEKSLIDGNLTQKQYEGAEKELEKTYYEDRLKIIQQYGGDEVDTQKKLLDIDLANNKQEKEAAKKVLEDKYSKTDNTDEQAAINEELYSNDLESYEDYEQKKVDIAQKKADQRRQIEQTLQDGINNILNSASSYYSAVSQAEQNEVTNKYDKEIEAAGENTTQGKKLEEKKQKELARIKSKYNKKAMKIEIAQAIASTASNAIAAYGSVLVKSQPWTYPLAIVAAAAATASGMLQIATIKKQHEAEESGYAVGGYTGNGDWQQEAGKVHRNEWVASHNVLQNSVSAGVVSLLDSAQKSNTLSTLTPEKVAAAAGAQTKIAVPIVNVSSGDAEMAKTLDGVNETMSNLNKEVQKGFKAYVILDGADGFDAQYRHYQNLKNNR